VSDVNWTELARDRVPFLEEPSTAREARTGVLTAICDPAVVVLQ
jgi:hypothetical protein